MSPKKPLLSIIIPTLNNEVLLKDFFKYFKEQKFDLTTVEIIMADGGSTDRTRAIGRQAGARIVDNLQVLAEPGVNLGMKTAQGEVMMILAADNFMVDKLFLKKMIQPFAQQEIMAAFPKQVSLPNDFWLNKYLNTFTDPFNNFVYGAAANARTFGKVYQILEQGDNFVVYDYLSNPDQPLIALAQGFTIRRGFKRDAKDAMDDVSSVMRLIEKGEKIAYVHGTGIYHDSIRSVKQFIRKQQWATSNALNSKDYGIHHRQSRLSATQKRRQKWWPIYVLTIFPPLVVSIYQWLKSQESNWLYNPAACYLSAWASIKAVFAKPISRQ